MKILVINAGSSSLKYQLFDMDSGSVMAKGLCERIGSPESAIVHKKAGGESYQKEAPMPTHEEALAITLGCLTDREHGVIGGIEEIDAVGHRVAHGGERYKESSLINEEMIRYLQSIVRLNPLHGPPAIMGIEACRRLMKNTPQVAVFDTSFYSDIKDFRYIYPLPYELYEEKKIRRYGFHGTSHRYVSGRAAAFLGKKPEELKIVTCHLGNGSSITAVDKGMAVDTSMGFTPQEGVLMGTRSGSIDPTILTYLMNTEGMTPAEADDLLNKKSGFLGVSGVSNDTRNIQKAAEAGNYRAQLALNILVHQIKKYIGSYAAVMNGLDVLVFTAGIGENYAELRRDVCRDMDYFGILLDEERNAGAVGGKETDISAPDSRTKVLVIPTNEEYMIALDTAKLVG